MTRRKSKHPPESRHAIVAAIREGATLTQAARAARVPPRTVSDWLRKGRAALDEWGEAVEDLYPDEEPPDDADLPELPELAAFALDADEAIGWRNLKWIQDLQAAEGSSWTRFAWLLERTTPEDFSLRENVVRRLEITGAEGGPVPAVPDLPAVLAVLAAAGAAAGDEDPDGDEAA